MVKERARFRRRAIPDVVEKRARLRRRALDLYSRLKTDLGLQNLDTPGTFSSGVSAPAECDNLVIFLLHADFT